METKSLLEMRKFVAPEFVFGQGALALAGQYAQNLGARKVMVVSDAGVKEAGWTDKVVASLKGQGLPVAVFSQVTPNPRHYEVMEGAEVFKEEGCNSIVAIGGGSPMDCAKGIGIVAAQGGNILDYEGIDRVSLPIPPLICLPTTSGSGAEVSQFCIISDQTRKIKIGIVSKATVPDVALIDPETTTTMDDYLTACTGLDALVHAIEAYVSNTSSPITDRHALAAIGLVNRHLIHAMNHPQDLQARAKIALACLEAGLAFSNAILGAVHALAHSLGGLLDVIHGECNAILLEQVIRYNFPVAEDRYRDIAVALGIDAAGLRGEELLQSLLEHLAALRRAAGINKTLCDLGVKPQHLEALAMAAYNDACLVTNPREAGPEDLVAILKNAL